MKVTLAALAAIALLLTTSCERGVQDASASAAAARLNLPQQLVGLTVSAEEIGPGLQSIDRPYVDTVALFSLRDGDLLRASLQVNRFNSAARPDDRPFRDSILGTIGGSAPLAVRVADTTVHVTTASDQTVFVWFDGSGMFVLAVQRAFEFPRTLLRRILEQDLRL